MGLDHSPARGYFRDLHGFKDFVGMVVVCAPDKFFEEDDLPLDDQLNLERAFDGLRYGLKLAAEETGETERLRKCRELVEQAYVEYQEGHDREGQQKLEVMEKLLLELPSQ